MLRGTECGYGGEQVTVGQSEKKEMASTAATGGEARQGQAQACLGNSLVPLVNRLQDAIALAGPEVEQEAGLELPQIAVVGAQSSGKSSVLESLVGRDFLPRGTGVCTRRPLVLQLMSARTGSYEWAEFLHRPDEVFTDFDQVRNEIARQSPEGDRAVSDEQLRLRIHSPHVLTMTLVDLPGITRVAVGDQPPDIEHKLKALIHRYAKQETCVLLAVSPATQDLAASDAIQLAREADPQGERTLGVITKADLMDEGTSAAPILKNEDVPLRLGYYAVVCRSQQGITNGTSMSEALRKEDRFFNSHPAYSHVSNRCGTRALATGLSQLLARNIAAALPTLRDRVAAVEARAREEAESLGEPPPEDPGERAHVVARLAERFAQMVAKALSEGETNGDGTLKGGARVRQVLKETVQERLSETDPVSKISDKDIETAVMASQGLDGGGDAARRLIPACVEEMRPLARECLSRVRAEVLSVGTEAATKAAGRGRLPNLAERLSRALAECLDDGLVPALELANKLVDCQADFINPDHPRVPSPSEAFRRASEQGGQPSPAESEVTVAARATRIRLQEAWDLARDTLADALPKAAVSLVARQPERNLRERLRGVEDEEESGYGELLVEDPHTSERRSNAHRRLNALKSALDEIDALPGHLTASTSQGNGSASANDLVPHQSTNGFTSGVLPAQPGLSASLSQQSNGVLPPAKHQMNAY